jgi:hypothetical protein
MQHNSICPTSSLDICWALSRAGVRSNGNGALYKLYSEKLNSPLSVWQVLTMRPPLQFNFPRSIVVFVISARTSCTSMQSRSVILFAIMLHSMHPPRSQHPCTRQLLHHLKVVVLDAVLVVAQTVVVVMAVVARARAHSAAMHSIPHVASVHRSWFSVCNCPHTKYCNNSVFSNSFF